MRLISVVLVADNEKDRFRASQALLNYGFRFFETHKLYAANKPLTEARIWKGEVDKLPLGLAEDLYVTIPRGQHQDMNASLRVNAGIEAPVSEGAPFGNVTVTLRKASVAEAPLVALRDVAEGGLVSRLVDQTMMYFNSWFE
jgi:D-alanyl-D-alanine carboxypeptidase (penicillin-binding protein 5/6)